MTQGLEALVLPIDHNDAREVGAFLGGLLLGLLRVEWAITTPEFMKAAVEQHGLSPTKNEMKVEDLALDAAFDRVASDFPPAIRTKLLAQKADFIAAVRGRN